MARQRSEPAPASPIREKGLKRQTSTREPRTSSFVCVCVSNPVSKGTTLVLVLPYPTNLPTIVQ